MREKIRLLHIQETIGSGGVERLRLSIAKLIDPEKYELKIICTHTGGNIKDEIEGHGVEVIPIGKFKGIFDLKNHLKVQKIIASFKPHIIHGAVFEGVTMAAINGFIKRVPVIIIEETSDPKNRSWRGNLLMKIFSKLSDAIIGVSPGVMEYLHGTLNLSKHKAVLLNNGVVVPRKVETLEVTALKEKLGIHPDDIVVGSVGRMLHDENKRFSDLIKSFAILIAKHQNLKLVLVGDGPELELYQKLAIDLEIESKVIFTGYQSDVALYYNIMNVFTLVSANEAFGLVLAEAMLCKLPVVATKVGGMKYIVRDNSTGFLVEPYATDQIASKLDQLLSSETLRIKFGEEGHEIALREYTEDIYVKNLLEIYHRYL